MSQKMTYFLPSSALVSPHFFSQHQAAFVGHNSDVIPGGLASCLGVTQLEAAYFG
jgi:hypothetical protein